MPNRMDHAIAKTKGTVKAVKARFEGLTGVFATLAKQHGEAGSLLHAVVADRSKREELWPQIRTALLSHERAEMRVIYPSSACTTSCGRSRIVTTQRRASSSA